jgi:SpoVK/Ycf46/Vps4 family AAA+-type ATPase
MRTGETLEVPFDVLLVFATNLDPHQLGDEAFERRIRHKALIPSPTREEFVEIMRREARTQRIEFDQRVAEEFVDAFYFDEGRAPRGSHPGDILRNLSDFARFEGVPPAMTLPRLREAAEAFFVLDAA